MSIHPRWTVTIQDRMNTFLSVGWRIRKIRYTMEMLIRLHLARSDLALGVVLVRCENLIAN